MRNLFRPLLLIALLVVPVGAWAGPPSDSQLDELISSSGVGDMLQSYPHLIKDSARTRKADKRVKALMLNAFAPDQMLVIYRQEIQNALSEKQATELLSWYKTNLGKKITEAENAGNNPETLPLALQQAERLFEDEALVARVMEIDELSGASDLSAEIVSLMTQSMIRVMGHDPKVVMPDGVLKMLEDQTKIVTLIQMLFIYQELEVDEMEIYTSFLGNAASQKFYEASWSAFRRIFSEAGEKLGISIMTRKI